MCFAFDISPSLCRLCYFIMAIWVCRLRYFVMAPLLFRYGVFVLSPLNNEKTKWHKSATIVTKLLNRNTYMSIKRILRDVWNTGRVEQMAWTPDCDTITGVDDVQPVIPKHFKFFARFSKYKLWYPHV